VKGWLVGVLIAATCTSSYAENLICHGKIRTPDGTVGEGSRVLTVDFDSLVASIETLRGKASGLLTKSDQNYMGNLSANAGVNYSITLDRYSGEILLYQPPENPQPGQGFYSEFWGTCVRAAPKF
jgi:hypothetical protein